VHLVVAGCQVARGLACVLALTCSGMTRKSIDMRVLAVSFGTV
jgi:hypothetical protein